MNCSGFLVGSSLLMLSFWANTKIFCLEKYFTLPVTCGNIDCCFMHLTSFLMTCYAKVVKLIQLFLGLPCFDQWTSYGTSFSREFLSQFIRCKLLIIVTLDFWERESVEILRYSLSQFVTLWGHRTVQCRSPSIFSLRKCYFTVLDIVERFLTKIFGFIFYRAVNKCSPYPQF